MWHKRAKLLFSLLSYGPHIIASLCSRHILLLFLEDELIHELILRGLHLGQREVLAVEPVRLLLLLPDQRGQLLSPGLAMLGVGLESVALPDGDQLLLLHSGRHVVEDGDEAVGDVFKMR